MKNSVFLIGLCCLIFSFLTIGMANATTTESIDQNNNVIKNGEEISNLRILMSERESALSDKMLSYVNQSLEYSKNTINYFLIILSVISFIALILGWKTIKNIRDDAKEQTKIIAQKEIKKVTGKMESKIGEIDKKVGKKNKINLLWRKFSREDNLNNKLKITDKLIEADSTDYMAYGSKGLVLSDLDRNEEAIGYFDRALVINPKDIVALVNKAKCLISLNKKEVAISIYDEAIKIDIDNGSLYNAKALCLQELEKYQEALNCLNIAMNLEPKNYKYFISKAHILLSTKKYEEAIACFSRARSIESEKNNNACDYGYYAINISFAYHKKGDFLNAYKIASRGLSTGYHLELAVNKGLAAAALGKREEALELLESAYEIGGKISEVIYCKARVHALLQDSVDALSFLKKAIELDEKFKKDALSENDFVFLKDNEEFKQIIS